MLYATENNPYITSKLVGHKNMNTTIRYAGDLTEAERKQIVQQLSLFNPPRQRLK